MIHHPRTKKVSLAKLKIQQAVLEICAREGLTFVEAVQACAETLGALSRDALREERHPGDTEKGADEP